MHVPMNIKFLETDFDLCIANRITGSYYVRSSPEDLANLSCPIRLEDLASLAFPNHLEDLASPVYPIHLGDLAIPVYPSHLEGLASLAFPSHLEDLSRHVCPLRDLELVSKRPASY